MQVTLLYFDGCPSWRTTDQRLRELVDELGFDIDYRKVDTAEAAEQLSFRGSPTVLVDGRDPFARGDEPVGLSCRIHQTPDGPAGSPTLEQLREVLGGPFRQGRSLPWPHERPAQSAPGWTRTENPTGRGLTSRELADPTTSPSQATAVSAAASCTPKP